jgi:VanZ family protein
MAVIFVLSSIPGSALSPLEFANAHLIAHLILYGTLCYLGYNALRHQNYSGFMRDFSPLIALVFVALYGASDEYHQSFVPGRQEELKNLLWDISAAVAVVLTVIILQRIRNGTKKPQSN